MNHETYCPPPQATCLVAGGAHHRVLAQLDAAYRRREAALMESVRAAPPPPRPLAREDVAPRIMHWLNFRLGWWTMPEIRDGLGLRGRDVRAALDHLVFGELVRRWGRDRRVLFSTDAAGYPLGSHADLVVPLLATGPKRTMEIARPCGWKLTTTTGRLSALRTLGVAVKLEHANPSLGRCALWALGPEARP